VTKEDELLEFTYKNYKHEWSVRKVIPSMFYFGSNEWHPKPQWFLRAFDTEKGAMRDFAFNDIMSPEAARSVEANRLELDEAQQAAGIALGYPWYKDDQVNFPGATEKDGVCIGEHAGATIVQELAGKFTKLYEFNKMLPFLQALDDQVIEAAQGMLGALAILSPAKARERLRKAITARTTGRAMLGRQMMAESLAKQEAEKEKAK
jgi:predicted DNA-binding transcriptional regulator YafY